MLRYLLPLLIAAAPAAAFDIHRTPSGTGGAVRRMVEFHVTVGKCPALRPTKYAGHFWRSVKVPYQHVPARWAEDEPGLRAYIRGQIAEQNRTMLRPTAGWCEHARERYGHGRDKMIAATDGGDVTAKCATRGTCADSVIIDFF